MRMMYVFQEIECTVQEVSYEPATSFVKFCYIGVNISVGKGGKVSKCHCWL